MLLGQNKYTDCGMDNCGVILGRVIRSSPCPVDSRCSFHTGKAVQMWNCGSLRWRVLLEKLLDPQLVHEIPHISWNSKVHYHGCNSLPHVPSLSHRNPDHDFPSLVFKTHFKITLPCLRLPRSLSHSESPAKTLHACPLSPVCATCTTHLSLLHLISQYPFRHCNLPK